MSWHLQNQVDKNAEAGHYKSIYETAVMRSLASFADDDGGSCFPSLATLATRSQCSQSTVQRVLQQFKKRKWIDMKHTGRSNIYLILPHGCVEPKAVRAAFGGRVITENAGKLSNSRERMVSETIQDSQPDQSESSVRPIRMVSKTNESYQLPSSKNPHHVNSFSLGRETGAGAPEREKACSIIEGVTEEEESQSSVTQSETTTLRLQRSKSAMRGTDPQVNNAQQFSATQRCVCGYKHPAGMPTLEEISSEMLKLRGRGEYNPTEGEQLHDAWLASGFRMRTGPIRNWKASLRNWLRWRENGGSGVFD